MTVSGTSEFGVYRKSVDFYFKLHLVMKEIVDGNAKDYGEVQFEEEGLAVVYRGDSHV